MEAVAQSKWHYYYYITSYIFHLQDKFTPKKNPLSFRNPRVRQKHNGTASDLHKLKCHLNIDEPMNLFTNNQMHAHSLTTTHHTLYIIQYTISRGMYLSFFGGEQFVANGNEQMNERKKEVMNLIKRTHARTHYHLLRRIYMRARTLEIHFRKITQFS